MDTSELLKAVFRVPGAAAFGRVRSIGGLMSEEEQTEFLNGVLVKSVQARETGDLGGIADHLEEWERRAMAVVAARARLPFELDAPPWTPLRVPVSKARFALVTTGGFYVEGQEPYETDGPENLGDWSFREILKDTPRERLKIAHIHYDLSGPREDPNCVFPLDRFIELEREGIIGGLADTNYSFMGYIQQPDLLSTETAPEVAQRLKADGVNAVLLTST